MGTNGWWKNSTFSLSLITLDVLLTTELKVEQYKYESVRSKLKMGGNQTEENKCI